MFLPSLIGASTLVLGAMEGVADFAGYGFVTGLIDVLASLLAGALWSAYGPRVAFSTAAAVALAALAYSLACEPRAAADPADSLRRGYGGSSATAETGHYR